MAACPHCGRIHPEGAVFCPVTGLPFPAGRRMGFNLPAVFFGGGIALILLGLVFYFFGAPPFATLSDQPEPSPVFTPDQSVGATETTPTTAPSLTLVPTAIFTPLPSATPTPSPTPTATRPVYVTKTNVKDGALLVRVPAGSFVMGSDAGVDPYFWGAESPRHTVTITEDYWIYQTEVTNSMYEHCVAARACPLPQQKYARNMPSYYSNPAYADYPVVYVTWVSAESYCEWAGGRLPTEAQWEKAARGEQDARLFPWGDTPAIVTLANVCDIGCSETWADRGLNDGYPATAPVGSYPEGASPYGALDMAGNVWEWVFDYFQPTYPNGEAVDPLGPASSRHRGIRGGGYSNPPAGVRAVQRDGVRPDLSLETLGFRCVIKTGQLGSQ